MRLGEIYQLVMAFIALSQADFIGGPKQGFGMKFWLNFKQLLIMRVELIGKSIWEIVQWFEGISTQQEQKGPSFNSVQIQNPKSKIL